MPTGLAPSPEWRAAKLTRALALARLVLRFARVERVTRHEDGKRPETDSDHTVMLAVIACDLAPPTLNRGRVAEFAVVHDLVEAYAGDTQTLTIDAQGRAAKEEREREAFDKIRTSFGEGTWVVSTLMAYEARVEPEARYVYLLDKVLPKLTHLLNRAEAAKLLTDLEGFKASHAAQYRKLSEAFADDRPDLRNFLGLLRESMLASETAWERP